MDPQKQKLVAIASSAAALGLGFALAQKMAKKRGGCCKGKKNLPAAAAEPATLDNIVVPADSLVVHCTAPVNIAVIKYWGKRDEKLILPVNSSLSGTIDQDAMCSSTLIIASKSFEKDQMFLNNKEEDMSKNKRLMAILKELRSRAASYVDEESKSVLISADQWPQYKLRIISHNNFPTAAGLASSASGYACLTKCLSTLYGVEGSYEGELTAFARQGSGSACRSLYGGWVKWVMGEREDGKDSIAVQVANELHWPEIRVLILVANSGQKETPSTSGMQTSVETSPYLKYRAEVVVPQRMEAIEKAIRERDFHTFADITMRDSNSFHAVCADTEPPIFYMNSTSHHIISLVNAFNKYCGSNQAAYTFDAGPNAVIYTLDKHLDTLLHAFLHYFKPESVPIKSFVHDPTTVASLTVQRERALVEQKASKCTFSKPVEQIPAVDGELLNAMGPVNHADRVSQIIVTKLGSGARVVGTKHSFSS